MPITKNILGVTQAPDYEREVTEPRAAEDVAKEVQLERKPEANDPIVEAAVSALKEVAGTFNRDLDVQYDAESGMVIMKLYDAGGEEIRQIPPDDAIRMAQARKQMRAQYMDSIL